MNRQSFLALLFIASWIPAVLADNLLPVGAKAPQMMATDQDGRNMVGQGN